MKTEDGDKVNRSWWVLQGVTVYEKTLMRRSEEKNIKEKVIRKTEDGDNANKRRWDLQEKCEREDLNRRSE